MRKTVHESVKDFYTEAAKKTAKELCCPIAYNEDDIKHIPKDAIEIAYGCGSPVTLAGVKTGDTVLDLGSGGGIDCFIAAKYAGKNGRVIGIDMTDKMLDKAKGISKTAAKNLGYDVVEFKKGLLEDIPVSDEVVDIVTSNCVINLSPDKKKVFNEIYRILKNNGRFCISDVVSDKDVPEEMQDNERLWGECISGALKESDFFRLAKDAGFYGLETIKRYFFKEVNGIKFYSITVRGYKFKKGAKCVYIGQYAIYNGPFKSVQDDDGHEYPIGAPVEICTDTSEKLSRPPYKEFFTIIDAAKSGEGKACGPKCC